jgi:hypothetical protein
VPQNRVSDTLSHMTLNTRIGVVLPPEDPATSRAKPVTYEREYDNKE